MKLAKVTTNQVLILLVFHYFFAPAVGCKIDEDCLKRNLRLRCCEGVCKNRSDKCRTVCRVDSECRTNVGEKCISNFCQCKYGECLETTTVFTVLPTSFDPRRCVNSTHCGAEEICKNGVCEYVRPRLNSGVIAAVSIGCCIVFVCAFYFCLKSTHSERPSVRARQKERQTRMQAKSKDFEDFEVKNPQEKLSNSLPSQIPMITVTATPD